MLNTEMYLRVTHVIAKEHTIILKCIRIKFYRRFPRIWQGSCRSALFDRYIARIIYALNYVHASVLRQKESSNSS